MFKILETENSVFTMSRRILELAEKQTIITNSMIRQTRHLFTEEAFQEIKEYEQMIFKKT